MARVFPTALDGLLGADVLSDFDIDLDLPHHEMTFYEKQTCPTAAPDWRGPYAALETGFSRGERLFFPVRLDGHSLTALIDTGSQRTALSTEAAGALGLTESLLEQDRLVTTHGIAAGPLPARVHRFRTLQVGTAVIANPDTLVIDLKPGDADMILGIDFLRSRRLWSSYGARRVFLSSP